MTKIRRKKQTELLRNRVMVLLGVAIVVLIAVILWSDPPAAPPSLPADESGISQEPQSEPPLPSSSPDNPPESSSVSLDSPPESSSVSLDSPPESSSLSQSSSSPGVADPPPADALYYKAEMPLLVNPTNKIPDDYKPDVAEMGNGFSYDRTATIAYNALLQKAKQDGISLWVVSAYRSFDKQTTNFQNMVKDYQSKGYTAEQAYATTAQIIAVPGTSEHSLGLALDLNSLETSFENTKEFKWLIANCANFGFILRYPKDKVEITGITYEPWHYRYVGSNHAKVIMEKKICLEEYLSGTYE